MTGVLLSEQETPAALRPPPLGQVRWSPWCRQWDRDISVPEQRTPLITTASALTSPGQYHVSCCKTRPVVHSWHLPAKLIIRIQIWCRNDEKQRAKVSESELKAFTLSVLQWQQWKGDSPLWPAEGTAYQLTASWMDYWSCGAWAVH